MLGHVLAKVDHHPYLGVELSSNMSWQHHINNTAAKAQRAVNFVRRNLNKCDTETKSLAYKALVRPIMEYASTVWDPYQVNQIYQLERVQRLAARFTMGDYSRYSSVTDMLNYLEWQTLQERRACARLGMFHKLINQNIAIPVPDYITGKNSVGRGGHSCQYAIPRAYIDTYKYSFFPRTIRCWNLLPEEMVTQATTTAFLAQLRRSMGNESIIVTPNPRDTYHQPQLSTPSLQPTIIY